MSVWAMADETRRSQVETMLREGVPVRQIARVVGTSHASVARYATSMRREAPRAPHQGESDEITRLRRALTHAFNHFENYGDKVSYDRFCAAQNALNEARASARDSRGGLAG